MDPDTLATIVAAGSVVLAYKRVLATRAWPNLAVFVPVACAAHFWAAARTAPPGRALAESVVLAALLIAIVLLGYLLRERLGVEEDDGP
ncbi:MAG: hypothetical protein V2I63_06615 [Pseudomonadales bacterium]|jgi:hypothetical protein|nr:hypothetical protein [Pseudomonadales bacterium]